MYQICTVDVATEVRFTLGALSRQVRCHFGVPAAAVLALTVASGPAFGQEKPVEKPVAAGAGAVAKIEVPPAPSPAVTHHRITIDGKPIAYTATAATIDLENDKQEVTGRMFYVAYAEEGVSDVRTRPVTFIFNGGPGSSTIWLHMGSFGPVRVATADAVPTPPPPYTVADNPDSLLDRSDLVFIDAIGTGYSRILGKGEAKDFYGTDPDVDSFAQFIERWVGANGRWNSPKFLLGESYGTTRAAALLNALQTRGMAFNGAILVSSYLNAYDDFNGPPFASDLPYELYLPTMAAAAWYHGRVEPKPADLAAFVEQARQFALGDYARALAKGANLGAADRDAIVAALHRFTGMPESLIREADLRIAPDRFEKALLRGERRTIGRLDARFTGIDHDAAGESPEYDAADAAVAAAFVSAFNGYAHGALKYDSQDLYRPTNYPEVGRNWDDHHRVDGGRWDMPDVAADLRIAMSKNPRLRVFSANGYYDFATPFFETEYTLAHMGLDPSLRKNITFGYYESGHMIYLHDAARQKLRADLGTFYDQVLAAQR
jgi:carboxypeptidase C (cathepsin A)